MSLRAVCATLTTRTKLVSPISPGERSRATPSWTRTPHIVESVCARGALAACEENLWALHYWREKAAEVDLVLDRKTDILPVEVKYRAGKTGRTDGLSAFKAAFRGANIPVGVVITKDRLAAESDTLYVPFWLVR